MSVRVQIIARIVRLVILCISSVYGFLFLNLAVLRFLFNPIGFFRVKHRCAPPRCMQDAQYGVHKYLKLQDGRKLHYVANGNSSSRLILLIHGFPETWWSWRFQLTALANDNYVVAVSLPGYCESDDAKETRGYQLKHLAQDMRALIEHLGHKQAVVIGHDWGGAISWELAHRYPEVVNRLVVMDCPHPQAYEKRLYSSTQFFRSWFVFLHQVPFLPELLWRANDFEFLDLTMASKWFGVGNREILTDEDMECFKYYLSKRGFQAPLAYYKQVLSVEVLADSINEKQWCKPEKVKPKTLILWGSADSFLLPALAFDSAKECQDARVIIIQNASHWLQQHEPVAVNKAIVDFLSRA